MNHSWNRNKGTVRGMHYQIPPFQEIKLIRCVRGAVLDVIVDLRKYSPTFLQHFPGCHRSAVGKLQVIVLDPDRKSEKRRSPDFGDRQR